MIRQRILVIEDDPAIRRGVTDALKFEGYQTTEAGRADTGLAAVLTGDADIVLLDLVMPGGDGLDVLHEIRKQRPTLPVIILTARGEEADRVRGLRLGADDYVVKPFSVRELLARVSAVLRRSPERPSPLAQIPIPGGVVDLPRLEVRFDDGECGELSEKEGELLAYLASHDGRVLSRDELLTRLWRLDARGVETRTIDMHVARLREKLRDDPHAPRVIVTVRGRGYKFGATAPRE